MLDITSECKSLFGIINEPEETQEEVTVFCSSSLSFYLVESFKRLCVISIHVKNSF